jgi:hypothetical protein
MRDGQPFYFTSQGIGRRVPGQKVPPRYQSIYDVPDVCLVLYCI